MNIIKAVDYLIVGSGSGGSVLAESTQPKPGHKLPSSRGRRLGSASTYSRACWLSAHHR